MLHEISFIKTLIPFMREEPSWPNHLLKALSLSTLATPECWCAYI
jgi:hypothetical protein